MTKNFIDRWNDHRAKSGPMKKRAQFFGATEEVAEAPGAEAMPPITDAAPPEAVAGPQAPPPADLGAHLKTAAEAAFERLLKERKADLDDVDKNEAVQRLQDFLTNDLATYMEGGEYINDVFDYVGDADIFVAVARGGARQIEDKKPASPKPSSPKPAAPKTDDKKDEPKEDKKDEDKKEEKDA